MCLLATLLCATPASSQTALIDLPEAPVRQSSAPQSTTQTTSQTPSPTPGTSDTQNSTTQQTQDQETKEQERKRAEEELKKEEKQRILGIVPNFSTTNVQNAAPLSPRQKFQLDLHSSLDPFVFLFAGLDGAVEQAEDTYPEYGQGAAGYGKRVGASYADTFDGGLWGNAILPILFHEDPRYFRRGSGSFRSRALYSAFTTIWCKRDNGSWGPNYANVGGNFVAGGISNIYYPESDRGFGLTVSRALTVTAEGAIGSEFVEFWPDISQHLFHKRDRSLTAPTVQPQTPPETNNPVQPAPPKQPAS
jgi:hypothetical protein